MCAHYNPVNPLICMILSDSVQFIPSNPVFCETLVIHYKTCLEILVTMAVGIYLVGQRKIIPM